LSCKEIFALVVVSLGIVLLVYQYNRYYGLLACFLGICWLSLTLFVIIPLFSPTGLPAGAERYISFDSRSSIKNLLFKLNLREIFDYTKGLFLPVIPFLSKRSLIPLLGILPIFLINCLSSESFQRNYSFHYSLPICAFLLLACCCGFNRVTRFVWLFRLWPIVIFFLILFKGFFSIGINYPFSWYRDNRSRTNYEKAISFVNNNESVIAPSHLIPHLAARQNIVLLNDSTLINFSNYKFIIIDTKEPGWLVTKKLAKKFLNLVERSKNYRVLYTRGEIYVFERK
jgi:uncharacterized membrane protein